VPEALLEASAGGVDGKARELVTKLYSERRLDEELARWTVRAWQFALEQRTQDTVFKKTDPDPEPLPNPLWKSKWAIGAVLIALLYWFYPSATPVEIDSVKFFSGGDNLQGQINDSTPTRSDYKNDFKTNEVNFVYYDVRLNQPAPNDVAIDIVWQFPNGNKVSQERSIKAGNRGVIYGWGFKQTPNWAVGRYTVEFSRQGKKLAGAEFNMSAPAFDPNKWPPPSSNPPFSNPFFPKQEPTRSSSFDIAAIQANVIGQLRFYEGPRKAPQIGSRFYSNVFNARDSRWIWGEINITNAGQLSPQNFSLTVVWSRNGAQVFRGSYDFVSPKPGQNNFYSVSFGADKPGLFLGTYKLDIYAGDKLLRTSTFTVR
jgi:hypothetical protein